MTTPTTVKKRLGGTSQSALSMSTGIAQPNLSAFFNGRAALGLAACKSLAAAVPGGGLNPRALYVNGHVSALKNKVGRTPAETLQTASTVLKTLRGEPTDAEMSAAIDELVALVNDDLTYKEDLAATKSTPATDQLGRDGSGRKRQKPHEVGGLEAERERVATKAKRHGDALGRGAGGRKIAKRHDLV